MMAAQDVINMPVISNVGLIHGGLVAIKKGKRTMKVRYWIVGGSIALLFLLTGCADLTSTLSTDTPSSSQQSQDAPVNQTGVPTDYQDLGVPSCQGDNSANSAADCAGSLVQRWAGPDLWQAIQAYHMISVGDAGPQQDVAPDGSAVADAIAEGPRNVFRVFYWSSSTSSTDRNWRHHIVVSQPFTKKNQVLIQEYYPVLLAWKLMIAITSNWQKAGFHPYQSGGVSIPHPQFGGNVEFYIGFCTPDQTCTPGTPFVRTPIIANTGWLDA